MAKKRMSVNQLKNLRQFQENPEGVEPLIEQIKLDFEDEKRIKNYMESMKKEYEMDDLNQNDRSALLDLATITIRIEDLDHRFKLESASEHPDWGEIKWLVDMLTDLRKSRSQIEDSLNITRKARQGAEQTSVVDAIEGYKTRAKKMLEDRLSYIYCPKCKLLVGNVWMLDPDAGNSFTFTCPRTLEDGRKCGTKFSVTGSLLKKNKNKNLEKMLDV